jgi:two-component system sensor histidine kinase VicK
VKNKPLFVALPEASGQGFEELLTNVFTTGERFVANELPVTLTRNGILETTWINFIYDPIRDIHGKITGIIVVCNEVTEQVNARKELEAAKEKFQMIADNIDQLAWIADETGYIFWYNQRWYDYTGCTLEEMQGWGWDKVHHPDHLEQVVEKWSANIKSGEIFEMTFPLKSRRGEFRWFLTRAVPLKNENAKIVRWFGTNTDITEQRRIEEQKDEFISIASHELKTPVTSLKVSLQLIERMKNAPTPALPKLVDQATRSMQKVTALIDELLNVNRINEGQLNLDKKNFLIHELVRSCCNAIREQNQQMIVMTGDTGIEVKADEHRVEQVIENFINNALKYAPNSGSIELIVTREKQQVRVAVKDNGPGIAPEKLPHLFDRYYRGDYSGIHYSGLGLGLYISAEIIRRHNGQIGVESKIGEGSVFWFTLPL